VCLFYAATLVTLSQFPRDALRYPPRYPSASSPDPSTGALHQVMLWGIEQWQIPPEVEDKGPYLAA
jgi:hypothetical protein